MVAGNPVARCRDRANATAAWRAVRDVAARRADTLGDVEEARRRRARRGVRGARVV